MQGLTHSSNNLRLQPILILETTSEVADTTLSVSCDIRHLSNVVVHVSAGEEQNCDQADSSPKISVLNDGEDVRHSDGSESNKSCLIDISANSPISTKLQYLTYPKHLSSGEQSEHS